MINVEKPDSRRLEQLGVSSWPVWEKGVSRFDWSYAGEETCYILEGRAVVEPEGGEPVEFKAGDLVTFSDGLNCVWDIREPVKKHYRLG